MTAGDPELPQRSTDEEDRGWGDDLPEPRADDARLLEDRPPHHEPRD